MFPICRYLVPFAKVQKQSTRGVLKNFTKFTGKHLCQSPFLIKLQASACNFIKKEALAQVFSYEFCEISKNTFSYRTPPMAVSESVNLA